MTVTHFIERLLALALVLALGAAACLGALALSLSLAGKVHGAPVPPAPKELAPELLVGRWSFEWGGSRDGVLWIFVDGTYTSVLDRKASVVYHGTWRVEGDTLTLAEWRFDPEHQSQSGPVEWRIPLDKSRYPRRLEGNANGLTPVVLRDPNR